MMDRVKAIEVLKPLVDSYVNHANITMKEEDDDIAEALEMAVEALRVLDVPDTNVGDMISRRAAIDAVESMLRRKFGIGGDLAEITLAGLPSAQPDHVADISKKVEGDCISRQAAIHALARMMPRSYTPDGSHPADEEIFRAQEVFADCIEALEILPSAQPATNCSEIPNGSDDTISRRAAIDALDCISGVEEVLRSLPSAQPEPHWIPCSKRLPEDGRCLVTRYDSVTNTCFSDILWYEKGVWWNRLCIGDFAVIAWMPLPSITGVMLSE